MNSLALFWILFILRFLSFELMPISIGSFTSNRYGTSLEIVRSISSEKRSMSSYTLDKEVPPLKVSFVDNFGFSKRRLSTQQTQKSFFL